MASRIICNHCKNTIHLPQANFCPYCGVEVSDPVPSVESLSPKYRSVYGVWRVITAGDVEGRTLKDLGVYEGYVDEIAKHLAPQQFYQLRFSKVDDPNIVPDIVKPIKKANISFDIESNSWHFNEKQLIALMRELFKDRPVEINERGGFAGVKLEFIEDNDSIEKIIEG